MSFFRTLLDSSFDSFVTVKIAKVVYIIAMVLIALSLLITLASGFVAIADGDGTGVAIFIFGPLFWLLILVIVRLWLENAIALIKVAENTAK